MAQGPNVRKLVATRISLIAIPSGSGMGSFVAAVAFLRSKEKILAAVGEATTWVAAAILSVRQAADPNPWRTASDEDIAGEILRGIDAKKKAI